MPETEEAMNLGLSVQLGHGRFWVSCLLAVLSDYIFIWRLVNEDSVLG